MNKEEKISQFLETLTVNATNVLDKKDAEKFSEFFRLQCKKCGSNEVDLLLDREGGSSCKTCGPVDPDDILVVKCKTCGAAVKIVNSGY